MQSQEMQVEDHCQQNQLIQVSYIDFEKLEKLDVNEEKAQIKDLKINLVNGDWRVQFEAINVIRSLNKFYNIIFCQQTLSELFPAIIELADSLRSNVQKNVLLLLKEIFLINQATKIPEDAVRKMVSKILQRSISNSNFIKNEAKEAIQSIENNKEASLCQGILDSLCEGCFDKNSSICELSCQTLHNCIKSNEENIQIINQSSMSLIAKTLAQNLIGKRAVMKKVSKEVCIYLNERIGEQAFSSLENNEKKIIEQSINEKKINEKPSLQDFIKKQKMQQE